MSRESYWRSPWHWSVWGTSQYFLRTFIPKGFMTLFPTFPVSTAAYGYSYMQYSYSYCGSGRDPSSFSLSFSSTWLEGWCKSLFGHRIDIRTRTYSSWTKYAVMMNAERFVRFPSASLLVVPSLHVRFVVLLVKAAVCMHAVQPASQVFLSFASWCVTDLLDECLVGGGIEKYETLYTCISLLSCLYKL